MTDAQESDELRDLLKRARESAKPKGSTFTVTVWAISTNPIHWVIDSKLKDPVTGNLVFNKKNDQMPKRDYYLVDFVLEDHTGLDLRFDPNPMQAFWVVLGDKTTTPPCPKNAAYSNEIYAISDDPGGKRLTIRNDDMDQLLFSYSLGFVSDVDDQPYRCDPGGDNQDGYYRFDYY